MSFATGTHRTSKRGGKDYIYLLHAPGCFANGDATTDAAFSSFFLTFFHYITAITDRVTIAVFIPAIFSMYINVCRKTKDQGEEWGGEC